MAHLSRKELGSSATEMEEMDRMDQMDNRLDVEKSKLMEIVKFDEEKEEEKTLLVTEDTKAEVAVTDNRHQYFPLHIANKKLPDQHSRFHSLPLSISRLLCRQ